MVQAYIQKVTDFCLCFELKSVKQLLHTTKTMMSMLYENAILILIMQQNLYQMKR